MQKLNSFFLGGIFVVLLFSWLGGESRPTTGRGAGPVSGAQRASESVLSDTEAARWAVDMVRERRGFEDPCRVYDGRMPVYSWAFHRDAYGEEIFSFPTSYFEDFKKQHTYCAVRDALIRRFNGWMSASSAVRSLDLYTIEADDQPREGGLHQRINSPPPVGHWKPGREGEVWEIDTDRCISTLRSSEWSDSLGHCLLLFMEHYSSRDIANDAILLEAMETSPDPWLRSNGLEVKPAHLFLLDVGFDCEYQLRPGQDWCPVVDHDGDPWTEPHGCRCVR